MDFEKAFEDIEDLFGTDPESILVRHYNRLDAALPVLDIGAGQGRNTLFLADEGYRVDALEPSSSARNALLESAAEFKQVRVFANHFENFQPDVETYTGVLAFGILQVLAWAQIEKLKQKIKLWTSPGSLIFVTAFTTEDPSYKKTAASWTRKEENSFLSKDGRIRTYLEPGQILDLFKDFKLFFYWEGLGSIHRHGKGSAEQHAMAEVVFQR